MAARASSEFVHRSARCGLDGCRTAPSGARGPCRPPEDGQPAALHFGAGNPTSSCRLQGVQGGRDPGTQQVLSK